MLPSSYVGFARIAVVVCAVERCDRRAGKVGREEWKFGRARGKMTG